MARVCLDWYPKGWDKRQRKDGFYMDDNLKAQLDILLKNIADDWDFTIIITGQGEVRVGKSVLAMQIGAYWASEVQRLYKKNIILNVETNFCYDGRKLIQQGNYLGQNYPFSPLIFDEAGADLEGTKAMQIITQDVMDFYRECGQYNLLNILVLPDFFSLPKGIAITRSIFLLDAYYVADAEGKFQRGYFNFYSKRNKKFLYLNGKKDLNYMAHRYNFHGRFYPFYPVDESDYRMAKQNALKNRESKRRNRFQSMRDGAWYILHKEIGLSTTEIGQKMENLTGIYTPESTVREALAKYNSEHE